MTLPIALEKASGNASSSHMMLAETNMDILARKSSIIHATAIITTTALSIKTKNRISFFQYYID